MSVLRNLVTWEVSLPEATICWWGCQGCKGVLNHNLWFLTIPPRFSNPRMMHHLLIWELEFVLIFKELRRFVAPKIKPKPGKKRQNPGNSSGFLQSIHFCGEAQKLNLHDFRLLEPVFFGRTQGKQKPINHSNQWGDRKSTKDPAHGDDVVDPEGPGENAFVDEGEISWYEGEKSDCRVFSCGWTPQCWEFEFFFCHLSCH